MIRVRKPYRRAYASARLTKMSIEKTAAIPVARLRGMIEDSHERSLALSRDLGPEQLAAAPPGPTNPVPWEIGHIAWLQERFLLRGEGAATLIADSDERFDPSRTRHSDRAEAVRSGLDGVLEYKDRVHDALRGKLDGLDGGELAGAEAYLFQLAAIVEDMRGEAMLHGRQAMGWPAPSFVTGAVAPAAEGSPAGDVGLPEGVHMLGGEPGDGFIMDNEEWGHGFEVAPFEIARIAVTNAEFMAFVDDGGYRRRELWSPQGWGWRDHAGAEHPVYWLRDGDWKARSFDQFAPLAGDAAVVHVNWFEADAWCRWAGRRLPSEAEWEVAASRAPSPDRDKLHGPKRRYPWGDAPPDALRANLDGAAGGPLDVAALAAGDSAWGCRQMIGNVWEWTNSVFVHYPGFMPGPYGEFSKPWFETGRTVLRGGSWATRSRQIWNSWRYFHLPERRDIFAGFRTCAK